MNHACSVAKGWTVSSAMVTQEAKIKRLRKPCQRRKLGSVYWVNIERRNDFLEAAVSLMW